MNLTENDIADSKNKIIHMNDRLEFINKKCTYDELYMIINKYLQQVIEKDDDINFEKYIHDIFDHSDWLKFHDAYNGTLEKHGSLLINNEIYTSYFKNNIFDDDTEKKYYMNFYNIIIDKIIKSNANKCAKKLLTQDFIFNHDNFDSWKILEELGRLSVLFITTGRIADAPWRPLTFKNAYYFGPDAGSDSDSDGDLRDPNYSEWLEYQQYKNMYFCNMSIFLRIALEKKINMEFYLKNAPKCDVINALNNIELLPSRFNISTLIDENFFQDVITVIGKSKCVKNSKCLKTCVNINQLMAWSYINNSADKLIKILKSEKIKSIEFPSIIDVAFKQTFDNALSKKIKWSTHFGISNLNTSNFEKNKDYFIELLKDIWNKRLLFITTKQNNFDKTINDMLNNDNIINPLWKNEIVYCTNTKNFEMYPHLLTDIKSKILYFILHSLIL